MSLEGEVQSQSPPPAAAPAATSPPPAAPASSPASGGVSPPPPAVAPAAAGGGQAPDFRSALASHPDLLSQWEQREQELRRYQEDVQRLSPLAQIGYQHWTQQQQQPRTPAAQPEAKHPWGVPQFDRNLTKFLSRDAQGNIVASPYAPPGLAAQYEAWQSAREQALEKLLDDPVGTVWGAIEERVKAAAAETSGSRLQQTQHQAYAQQYVQQNADWLYDKAAGYDPLTGEPRLSPAGRQYLQAVQDLRAAGMTDPVRLSRTAEQLVFGGLALNQYQQTRGQAAAQQADAGKRNLLDAAAQASAAGASTPAQPVPSPSRRLSLREMARQEALQGGLDLNAAAADPSLSN